MPFAWDGVSIEIPCSLKNVCIDVHILEKLSEVQEASIDFITLLINLVNFPNMAFLSCNILLSILMEHNTWAMINKTTTNCPFVTIESIPKE